VSTVRFSAEAIAAAAVALILALSNVAGAQAVRETAPDPGDDALIAELIDGARQLAGNDLTAPFDFFCVAGNARPNDPGAPPLEPVKLFDNLYAAGNSETLVHAIETSEGIVLIDSGFADEVETVLVPGLIELGLDPVDVKLVLLGHGHADHYGGAAYFQSRYGARVGTTDADWETIAQAPNDGPRSAPKPSRDLIIREGTPIVLGDTSIAPIAVPGHTPGALAYVFSVFDSGTRHVAGLFGGTVLSADYVSRSGLMQYVDSISHYLDVAERMGVDVEVQNHPIFDDTPARIAALATRGPDEPHPFVMGTDKYLRFWNVVAECMQAEILRRNDAPPSSR
jgi:metallo-beta-lactamase class B